MINKIFLKIVNFIIELIDYSGKKKIINFFKKKFIYERLKIIDIGAHKGETIDLFYKNFKIDKIYCFEPNLKLFNILKNQKKYNNRNVELYNYGVGLTETNALLNVMADSASSTFNTLNLDSKYYKKKNKILTIFSKKKELLQDKQIVKIINLSNFFKKKNILEIDLLKIDSEGYEYKILKGIKSLDFAKIKFIYFEHHYDLMINKGYSFSDINKLLSNNFFKKKYKIKMRFRKSFEYIYENQNFKSKS